MKHFFIAVALAAIAASASAAPVNSQFHHQIPTSALQGAANNNHQVMPGSQHQRGAANANDDHHWMSAPQHPPPTRGQLRRAIEAYHDLGLSHAEAKEEANFAAHRTGHGHWSQTADWHHIQSVSAALNSSSIASGVVPHGWNAHNVLQRTERVEAAEKDCGKTFMMRGTLNSLAKLLEIGFEEGEVVQLGSAVPAHVFKFEIVIVDKTMLYTEN